MKNTTTVAVSLILLFGLFGACSGRVKKEESYVLQVKGMAGVIARQGSACISQSKYFRVVWEYAQATGLDFETAAKEMSSDMAAENRRMMVENKALIQERLERMKNPTSRFAGAHAKLLELYDLYVRLHDLALEFPADIEEHEKAVFNLASRFDEKREALEAELRMLEER